MSLALARSEHILAVAVITWAAGLVEGKKRRRHRVSRFRRLPRSAAPRTNCYGALNLAPQPKRANLPRVEPLARGLFSALT